MGSETGKGKWKETDAPPRLPRPVTVWGELGRRAGTARPACRGRGGPAGAGARPAPFLAGSRGRCRLARAQGGRGEVSASCRPPRRHKQLFWARAALQAEPLLVNKSPGRVSLTGAAPKAAELRETLSQ